MIEEKRKLNKKIRAALLLLIIVLALSSCGKVNIEKDLDKEATSTAKYLLEETPEPTISSIGGEWAIKGLVESGVEIEKSYIDSYYDNVRAATKSEKGILADTNYTEYARITIALCAIGKDPKNVEGYNLVKPLDNYEKVLSQGENAVAFALIASNTAEVKLNNEEKYIDILVTNLNSRKDNLTAKGMDYTAMSLQGLSFYIDRNEIKDLVTETADALSKLQQDDGSYKNCETTAECILALTSIGIDPFTDEKFIKGDNSLADGLMQFKSGKGFKHDVDEGKDNKLSTEKGLMALDALKLYKEKNIGIY